MNDGFEDIVFYTKNMFINQSNKKSQYLMKIELLIRKLLKRNKNISIYNWKNCLLALSLIESYSLNKDKSILHVVTEYANGFIKKFEMKEIDTSIMGELLLELKDIYQTTIYDETIHKIYEYIRNAPADKEGSKFYRPISSDYIFADTIGMICPFLFRYSKTFTNTDAVNIAVTQIDNFIKHAIDEKTGLFYHGYEKQSSKCSGIIGWGRAEGWVMRGMVESLEYIDDFKRDDYLRFIDSHFKIYDEYTVDSKYLSWQITCTKGQIDTTTMAMLICSMIKYYKFVKKSNHCYLMDGLIEFEKNGIIHSCSSECLGFSMYPQIYGNNDFGQAFYLLSMCYKIKYMRLIHE